MLLNKEAYNDIFVRSGAVTQEQFDSLIDTKETQELGFDQALVARGVLSEREAGQLMSMRFNVPFADLTRTEIRAQDVALLPEAYARAQDVLVIDQTPKRVRVAATNPDDPLLRSQLEKWFRKNVEFSYATPRGLRQQFYLYQADPQERLQMILDLKAGTQAGMDTRVVDLINAIMEIAYQRRVSDIHLEPEEDYLVLRYREDGLLHDIIRIPVELHEQMVSRVKVLARLATDEHRKAQDGRISYESPWGNSVEIRVSVIPTTHHEKVVMRLLTDQTQAFSLAELGFSTTDYSRIIDAIRRPWGMILATGPTGSGKTTSLYAMLQLLNERDVNITTIEDPVEVDLDGVNQIQVNERAGLTFAKGLRSIVRQDPDIIMVGEIRDPDTASIAVNAAMTGHLVLSTLHTNDAATAFVRLFDFGIEPFLIASTINAIVAQRLVRKVCMNCVESSPMNDQHKQLLARVPQIEKLLLSLAQKKRLDDLRLFIGKGCKVCHTTGYRGRIGIFETLQVTDEIRVAVMSKQNAEYISKIALGQGMTSMVQDGLQKALLGQTTIEEVLRVSELEE